MFKVIDGEFDKDARIYKRIGTEKYFFSTVENYTIKDIPINNNIQTLHVLTTEEVEYMLLDFKFKASHKLLKKALKDRKEVCIKCELKDKQSFTAVVDYKTLELLQKLQSTPIIEAEYINKDWNVKKGCLWVIGIYVILCMLGAIISVVVSNNSPKSQNSTSKTASAPVHHTSVNKFKSIGLTTTQEKNIRKALNKCGITQIESIKRMDYSQIGFDVKAKNVDETIFLYLKESNKNRVEEICFSAEDLYMNGRVLRKLADYTLSTEQRLKIQISSEDYVRKTLKSPSSAYFPNYDEWNIYKKHGVIFAESYVDAQNSFGAVIRSHFKLTIKNNRIVKYTMDGEDLLN